MESIPKEREKKLPTPAGTGPIPKRAENREKIIKIPLIPRKTARATAMVRNLKCVSLENFKWIRLRFIIGKFSAIFDV
jgi:hypothetical protein